MNLFRKRKSKESFISIASRNALFVCEFVRYPFTVGSVCPSSARLARMMAKQVPLNGSGLIVELGAGTGAVTSALLKHGISVERLLIIEQSQTFVNCLCRLHPTIKVICGDATNLGNILPKGTKIDAIISSLPLRSLPSAKVSCITDQWRELLPSNGILVQFTYNLWKPASWQNSEFDEKRRQYIWRNIPPACITTHAKR